jgi:hypothetical protein
VPSEPAIQLSRLASISIGRPREHPSLRQSDVLSLQRTAGNRATTRLLGIDGERALAGATRREPGPPPGSLAPALDGAKESEADRVADRALARLGTSPAGGGARPTASTDAGVAAPRGVRNPSGARSGVGPVPQRLAAALAPDVGSLAGVSFDQSERAARDADSIGARAFAEGTRISFGRGELDLSSSEGVHLAAHEAAHAALHAPSGRGLVHAKLRGTARASEQMGGGRSSGGLRKLVGWKTNWDKILDGLGAYERLEDDVLATGNPTPQVLATAKPRLLDALVKVDGSIDAWRESNDEAGQTAKSESLFQSFRKGKSDVEKVGSDERTKAQRRQTVSMLQPRVRTELEDLRADRWSGTLGLSDTQLTSKGREDSGQMAKVSELFYQTESGEFSGFFKAETGYLPGAKTVGRDIKSGIRMADPNFGARAMAMYRLDQLLGAGVTARVEFAAHEGQLGVVLETAKGTKGAEVNWTSGEGGPGKVSSDDAVLQRCLNKLQILDAIALQLDRHSGNFYVQSDDQGKVTGVTGIDLDMAFGRDITSPDKAPQNFSAYAWRGLPPEIDEEFGRRILAVSEDQVRAALTGLLPEPEVEATVSRFRFVQGKVREAEDNGTLRHDWAAGSGGTTPRDKMKDFMEGAAEGTPTYTEGIRSIGVDNDAAAVMEEVARPRVESRLRELPIPTQTAYRKALFGNTSARWLSGRGFLYSLVAAELATRSMSLDQVKAAVGELVDEIFTGPGAALEVGVQEGGDEYTLAEQLKKDAAPLWPSILDRHRR